MLYIAVAVAVATTIPTSTLSTTAVLFELLELFFLVLPCLPFTATALVVVVVADDVVVVDIIVAVVVAAVAIVVVDVVDASAVAVVVAVVALVDVDVFAVLSWFTAAATAWATVTAFIQTCPALQQEQQLLMLSWC